MIQMSFNRHMVEQTMVHLHQGKPVSNIKEQTTDKYNNLGQSPQNMMNLQKPIVKGSIQYDSNYVTFSERPNFRNGEQISGLPRVRHGMKGRKGVVTKEQHKTSL